MHPDPGPPPRRPGPPGQERLYAAGWRPSTVRKAGGGPLKAGAAAGAAVAGRPRTERGRRADLRGRHRDRRLPGHHGGVCAGYLARCPGLRARVAAEEQRVARARAARESRLSGWQQEHARRLRDWEARGRAFQAQPQWYGVAVPTGVDRLDVAGGTLAGWSALTGTLAGLRLAAGGEVTVLDLSEGAVALDLQALAARPGSARWSGCCPGTCPGWISGPGCPPARRPTSWPRRPRPAIRPARRTRRRTAPSGTRCRAPRRAARFRRAQHRAGDRGPAGPGPDRRSAP